MIVAIQYYAGDLAQAMSLARLLADIESDFRNDVLLSLICQPGTPREPAVERTIVHCSLKFAVEHVESPLGAEGHPAGCTALWTGALQHYFARYLRGDCPRHASIFMVDGGDGVPLHRNWINLLRVEHRLTRCWGKSITGTPYFLGTCPLHVNPNAVFDFEVFKKTRLLTDVPEYDGTVLTNFDVYHRAEMLDNASLSSVVRTDWRGDGRRITREILLARSRESVWLHGYKDPRLYWLCREHVFSDPAPPQVNHYDLSDLRVHESVRRSYESCFVQPQEE